MLLPSCLLQFHEIKLDWKIFLKYLITISKIRTCCVISKENSHHDVRESYQTRSKMMEFLIVAVKLILVRCGGLQPRLKSHISGAFCCLRTCHVASSIFSWLRFRRSFSIMAKLPPCDFKYFSSTCFSEIGLLFSEIYNKSCIVFCCSFAALPLRSELIILPQTPMRSKR